MENSAPEAPGIDLVFDGDCGFCTRSALWIQGRDRDGSVHLHPLQRPGVLERFGLTHEEALSAVWAFRRGGGAGAGFRSTPPYRGAAAVNLALDAVFGTRIFSAVYRLPGLRWLQDLGYQWVADHRYLLRGATPWCLERPEDCPDATSR